ncbi:hypothetical protein HMPREF0043_02038 [Actinobaculum sp. oral taxon 183 str. F0552]|nr:hypothetical protein HMPREF0043_02038 [Actinobaculum sp. oral taxon 183 str. F0552]
MKHSFICVRTSSTWTAEIASGRPALRSRSQQRRAGLRRASPRIRRPPPRRRNRLLPKREAKPQGG